MPYQEIKTTKLSGVFVLIPKVFGDERGWYCPTYEAAEFKKATGISPEFTQEAESFNAQKGILRGLHYQIKNTQGKMVRVLRGAVYDVAVDLRQNSPTFGQSIGIELSESNRQQLWIPPGFAHGYLSLEENTWFSYLITDGIYDKPSERGINPFDPTLGIKWPTVRKKMSLLPRDLSWPLLADVTKEDLF